VDVRAVRLSQSIRRVGEYHVPIQFDRDLRTEVTLKVEPDRTLEAETKEPAPGQGHPAAGATGSGQGRPPGREFRPRREEEVIDAIEYDYNAPPKPKRDRDGDRDRRGRSSRTGSRN
jgi:hypothetical protein